MKRSLVFSLAILSFFALGHLWAAGPELTPAVTSTAETPTGPAQSAPQANTSPANEWLFKADADIDVLAGVRCCQSASSSCNNTCYPNGVLAFACVPTARCTYTCSCA